MVTLNVHELVRLAKSLAVQVTVVVPMGKANGVSVETAGVHVALWIPLASCALRAGVYALSLCEAALPEVVPTKSEGHVTVGGTTSLLITRKVHVAELRA